MEIKFTKKWVQIWNSKMKMKFSTYCLAKLELAEIMGKRKSA